MVPARRRDDKAKDKIGSKEQEVGVSCSDANKTSVTVSAGVKIKDTERKLGNVKEPVSAQQHGTKTEPVIVKADDTLTAKLNVRSTSRSKVMGNTTATVTSSGDAAGETGKKGDLAKPATTHTDTATSKDGEKQQREAAGTWPDRGRRDQLTSRRPLADAAMVVKARVEEQPAEGSELTQKIHDSGDTSSSPENHAAMDEMTNMAKRVEELQNEKRSLVSQEARLQEQLTELTVQLTARDNESNKLRYQMEDLQRDVLIKSSGMDRLQAELAAAHKESEFMRRRLRQLEEDLGSFKQKNTELQDELQKKAEEIQSSENESDSERVAELESKVKELEEKLQQLQLQLDEVRMERDKLEKARVEMEADREEEIKIIERALEEALEEKALVLARFEQDFEKLRTVNTDREQQLLDDFEWKLREVEQSCKRRLEEKDKALEERLKEGRKELELKLKLAEKQLLELPQLKTYEAEVIQLRGLTIEQQRALRVTTRQTEQLQVSERMLKEEVTRLRGQLDKEKSHAICMQSLHEKKMADNEKKFEARLDQQKSDVTAQWEERLRQECSRLKSELDQLHSEEKHLAVESAKVQKEQEMRTAKQNWDRRMQECLKEISTLKDRLTEKDSYYHGELEKAQTNADRDIFDLRRKLDKIDLSYQDQMEKLTEKYEKEIEQLNWESERKIQQLEQNWQLQMSSTRATLELVKEQMERDAQNRLDSAEEKHRKQLDIQWERLMNEKEKAVADLEEKHQKQMELIKTELEMASKNSSSKENEQLLEIIANLKKQLQGQTAVISDLQGNVDLLQGGMQVLNQEISTQNAEMQRLQTQTAHRLREREAQLEAEQRRKLTELKDQFAAESKQWQEQMQILKDQNQQKINRLVKLIQELEQKYKKRESRKEDVELIGHLKQVLEEREREITCLTEEKRFYQLELMKREATHNNLFSAQPTRGVLDPLQHHRKKGLKSMRGKCRLQPAETWSRQLMASSVPPLSTHTSTSHRNDFIMQKSKSLEPSMIHIKQSLSRKEPDTCTLVPTDKTNQVKSALDYVADLDGTTESSVVKTCGSQSVYTASWTNVPDEMVNSESRESTGVHSDQIIANQQSVTNCNSAIKEECTLTFNALDVPDSKISVLLESCNSAESKISNFKTRSKSVETAAKEVDANVLSSTSAPSLL